MKDCAEIESPHPHSRGPLDLFEPEAALAEVRGNLLNLRAAALFIEASGELKARISRDRLPRLDAMEESWPGRTSG